MWAWMKRSADTQQSLIDALREQLKAKDAQISELHRQIGMVIESKFETVHVSGERPENSTGTGLPPESLMDVATYNDEDFVTMMEKIVP